MFIDKTETYILNIGELTKRKQRNKLLKLLRQITFCKSIQHSIKKNNSIYTVEIILPKQQLPYVITYLSLHNYTIFQILTSSELDTLFDSTQLPLSSKRFELQIDGLNDAFIKDKVIDIINVLDNTEALSYTFTKNRINLHCSADTFSKIIYYIAIRNVDILKALYFPRVAHKMNSHIS